MAHLQPTQSRSVPALVRMLAAAGGPRLRQAFADAGLGDIRPAQALALSALVTGPRHASEIATDLRVTRQAVAQAVTALEKGDYIARIPDPDDARAKLITLTDRGRDALRVMRTNALTVQEHWRQILGEDELARLRSTLIRLIDASETM